MTSKPRKISRALISVFDKTGLLELVEKLNFLGIEIISTGGTAKVISEAGYAVTQVADITGFQEMMDGRVKTLHPSIHGGLLALRDNQEHIDAMVSNDILEIDLLVVNLYPFKETVAKGENYINCIENIDIGGPAMIRAAAKNHAFVTAIVDPKDYKDVLDELQKNNMSTGLELRKRLARKAFTVTATYDLNISNWMSGLEDANMPPSFGFIGNIEHSLRYGENPHQKAAFYKENELGDGFNSMRQIHGKELSYNNINDTSAAFELISEFNDDCYACAIIKHANPCGVALAKNQAKAYQGALECDKTSAFGGIVALNKTVEAETAELILQTFTEVLIAPDATKEAVQILKRSKNLRILLTGGLEKKNTNFLTWKKVNGGMLVQENDCGFLTPADVKVVTKRSPNNKELEDLMFAWKVAKHIKSNAIVFAKNRLTIGIGAGQMSRVDSARIAVHKSKDMIKLLNLESTFKSNFVVASDAFFPFADGIIEAVDAGAKAIIQPGGSIRDQEVIQAADDAGISMVFTNMRHFKH
jgi:phosphoribosylaminoimidazolecarboxamide formyltransferase/IMP cyclohydrolase